MDLKDTKNDSLNCAQQSSSYKKDWVRLNVGGTLIMTTKSTLSKDRRSLLYKISQDESDLEKDESGAFIIDRDPTNFKPVLNYLRHGKLVVDRNMIEEAVLEEAKFYNVTDLIKMLKTRIDSRDDKKSKGSRVYRVLHFHEEEEIVQTVSNMNNGWTFEQLINIEHQASNDEHGKFLCVVSGEHINSATSETSSTETWESKELEQTFSRM